MPIRLDDPVGSIGLKDQRSECPRRLEILRAERRLAVRGEVVLDNILYQHPTDSRRQPDVHMDSQRVALAHIERFCPFRYTPGSRLKGREFKILGYFGPDRYT